MNETLSPEVNPSPQPTQPVEQVATQTGNVYPAFRKFFLILIVLTVLLTLLFLLYMNGRSLYTYGL